MRGKYRLPDQSLAIPEPLEVESEEVALGYVGGAGRSIPLEAATRLDGLRFERGGVRKDFGWEQIGDAAASRVLGLIEHKFIAGTLQFRRVVRAIRNVSQECHLQVWDGNDWTDDLTSTETIADRLLSMLSIQGKLVIADGTKILIRDETTPGVAVEQDFPTGNSMTAPGDSEDITKDTVQAIDSTYTVNFSVDLTITNGTGYSVIVRVLMNGVIVGTRTLNLSSGSQTWSHEIVEFVSGILPTPNTVTLELTEVRAENAVAAGTGAFSPTGTSDYSLPVLEVTKGVNWPAQDDEYTFEFGVGGFSSINVKFFVDPTGLGPFVLVDSGSFAPSGGGTHTHTIEYAGLGATARFGLGVDSAAEDGLVGGVGVDWVKVEAGVDYDVDVHGFNKAVDADPAAGLEYDVPGAVAGVLELIDAAAPAARYLGSLGDRLLALWDDGDTQILSASADGDIRTWTGSDTYSTALLDSRGDPIDDLQALVPIGPDLAALFRKRSIMRVFETGNVALPIAAVHWLDGIGTESPFSPQIVPGGVVFLGHDRMVYIFSANGQIQPVGQAIHQDLIETLTGNIDLVDSAFDFAFGEYFLGIPEDGASNITACWILDIARILAGGSPRWRRRELTATRLTVAGDI